MIRVLLAEDQTTVRDALATLLGIQPGIAVVAAVGRGDEVVAAADAAQPDVALLDIEMPGLDGLTVAAQLHARLPRCKVLILTTFGRPGYMRRALAGGVAGFLLKETRGADLAVAIRRVMAGERVVDPELATAALAEGASPLTTREREVLAATARGESIAAIAAALSLSEGTVRNYVSDALHKLGAPNRAEAARIAERQGWL